MKISEFFLLFLVIASALAHGAQETKEQTQEQNMKTYLIKTDMTKQELEDLIAQHKKNKANKQMQNMEDPQTMEQKTELHMKPEPEQTEEETTALKVKKNKHAKQEKKPVEEEPTPVEAPETETETEPTTNLKKAKSKAQKHTKPAETQEAPEEPEPVEQEQAEADKTTTLKVKAKKQKHSQEKPAPEATEAQEAPEEPEATQQLAQECNTSLTEITPEQAKNLLQKEKAPGFFLSFFALFAVVGIAVYKFGYKKEVDARIKKYLKETFGQTTNEYLLVDNDEGRGML